MINVFKAVGLTILIVFAAIFVLAVVYISMWMVAGIAVILLLISTYSLLQAKSQI